MPFLDEKTRGEIKKLLDDLDAPVQLVTFTQELECDSCHANRELIEELAAISDKLHCQVFDFVKDAEKASELGVDKVPATVVVGPSGSRVRFYGIPAGYEFATLIEDVMMMSAADSGLSAATREKLRAIAKPVHLQVLVTPT